MNACMYGMLYRKMSLQRGVVGFFKKHSKGLCLSIKFLLSMNIVLYMGLYFAFGRYIIQTSAYELNSLLELHKFNDSKYCAFLRTLYQQQE